MTFTAEQLADFKAFRFLQGTGKYNMIDPRARIATGMTAERYQFVIAHYSELQKIADALSKEAKQ